MKTKTRRKEIHPPEAGKGDRRQKSAEARWRAAVARAYPEGSDFLAGATSESPIVLTGIAGTCGGQPAHLDVFRNTRNGLVIVARRGRAGVTLAATGRAALLAALTADLPARPDYAAALAELLTLLRESPQWCGPWEQLQKFAAMIGEPAGAAGCTVCGDNPPVAVLRRQKTGDRGPLKPLRLRPLNPPQGTVA